MKPLLIYCHILLIDVIRIHQAIKHIIRIKAWYIFKQIEHEFLGNIVGEGYIRRRFPPKIADISNVKI